MLLGESADIQSRKVTVPSRVRLGTGANLPSSWNVSTQIVPTKFEAGTPQRLIEITYANPEVSTSTCRRAVHEWL